MSDLRQGASGTFAKVEGQPWHGYQEYYYL
jgi:hypothetical protein